MNPYSFDLIPEPKQRSRWLTAARIAFSANIICCLHLGFCFCLLMYEIHYEQPSGCFSGDGFAELFAFSISFLFFWLSAMIAGFAARSRSLVLTTISIPVLSLFVVFVADYL